MSTQHITVTTTSGEITQISTTDPDVAREFERLPFEANHIESVKVSVTEE